MKKVILNPKRDYSVVHHHPWVFSGAIRAVEGDPAPGENVAVESARGERLGWGSWSPASQIRMRLLSFDPDREPDEAYVEGLVSASVARRAAFWVDGATNAFRLVNAESDGLPGVVADYYAGTVVVQLATAGAERWKDVIVSALMKYVPDCTCVYNRSDVDARAREGLEPATGLLAGAEPPELVEVKEGPVSFLVDVRKGHKTGFYLDQRDARAAVGALANGAVVLNCFCYTGGFGLFARACGAAKVTQVDVSADALALAKRNESLAHL
ncbi:MAG: class I SAM-dependent rRNA methyltransferase, partial [Kiritimatiellae bacterium]|nr:class I SAM-dependent rRNA methyltransferase [Kiritimatiellia bacterium]